MHKSKQGLELPIAGQPEVLLETAPQPPRVAIVADDYPGMKPTMHVQVGDAVRRGQLLFEDKKTQGVRYTAPGSGKVVAVNRGAKRALQTVVVELDEGERAGRGETARFAADTGKHPSQLDAGQVRDLLVESGLWTALRRRPFARVADPSTTPHSIFVTAMDSRPLAPPVAPMLEGRGDDLERGLVALSKLTEGTVFICKDPDTEISVPGGERFRVESFQGPHPAGTAGFHIHTLDPVDRRKLVWHLDIQDVLAIGRLFRDGELDVTRVVSFAGPVVRRPRLLRTRLGAELDTILRGELEPEVGTVRVISGSVLTGRSAMGAIHGFLGRYHNQISVLEEGTEREFLGWLAPGFEKYSTTNNYASKLIPGKRFRFTTSTQGSERSIVPFGGLYERVFPFDILPVPLLRAIVVGDIERAEVLGALELDEDDLAVCSFVCPSKNDYGVHLRDVLTTIEKEG
ncbi:MAG: Na(+)-translocating NADH-quinone reductase subunit A [Acidobacteriota bacterium]